MEQLTLMMITSYHDHELAAYQIVRFVDRRVGDSKSPQGPQWERESNEEEKSWKKSLEVPPLLGFAESEGSASRHQTLPWAT